MRPLRDGSGCGRCDCKVFVTECKHGTVEVIGNARHGCNAGDTVIVSITPEKGWQLKRLWADDNTGSSDTITAPDPSEETARLSDSFTMPSADVTVNGIITGMDDGNLARKDNATRAQIATMFIRFVGAMEK